MEWYVRTSEAKRAKEESDIFERVVCSTLAAMPMPQHPRIDREAYLAALVAKAARAGTTIERLAEMADRSVDELIDINVRREEVMLDESAADEMRGRIYRYARPVANMLIADVDGAVCRQINKRATGERL